MRIQLPHTFRGAGVSIVLSVVCSLAAVVILSKRHVPDYLWFDFAAVAVPIPIGLYFKKQIGLLGIYAYVAVLALALGAAILFGI
jgi:hypothetical protein